MTTSSTAASKADIQSSSLYNADLAPVTAERRTWSTYNYAALWVSMSVNTLTYILAASLVGKGMSWKQAVLTIFLGNTIVLAPMLLNSHPGARYGVPFPVLARASFGLLGANVAAVLRGLVACGWFGIQCWIGGEAINILLGTIWPAWHNNPYGVPICFLAFWAINLAVIVKGIEYIRFLQGLSAPILLGVGLLLLGWAYFAAGGFGPMLSAPSKFSSNREFFKALVPALNATVGFWSTVSLNIPDFTRFAKDERGQAIGQAFALPLTMTLYSFIGVAVTSATVVIYGTAISDPVQLLSRFHSPVTVVISLVAILLATLNVNIGANVVSPANDFSNLWPRRISFKIGGVITCIMGIAMMPWKLLANYDSFVVAWLGGYAAVLGSVAGIMICDYFIVRRKLLVVNELYLRGGQYEYAKGFNWHAIGALIVGSGVALMGLVIPAVRFLYDYSWFVGFAVAFGVYWALMVKQRSERGHDAGQAEPGITQGKLPPRYTRDLVIAKAKQFFPNENQDDILAILDLYGSAEKHRVHIAVLKMSEGNLERLRENVATAMFDYRDVVGAAEYEEDWLMRDPSLPNLNKPD